MLEITFMNFFVQYLCYCGLFANKNDENEEASGQVEAAEDPEE